MPATHPDLLTGGSELGILYDIFNEIKRHEDGATPQPELQRLGSSTKVLVSVDDLLHSNNIYFDVPDVLIENNYLVEVFLVAGEPSAVRESVRK
ncbi:hypothetical protein GALMADRAFT_258737 [Galerina marginata CBS 339.88]|uniref:Uncharacterized protein n=1 Tax=Galerina marginata (strain CBS 339.88) TaxID=685588 RepID=A0A067S7M6_GALM3|nr:hypothetical protein GALMADRAFT_258737 [Galerina marginata CBS 339.88]